MPFRLVFMGTPDFAVPTLSEIVKDHHVVAVYTKTPKPAGRRGLELTPTPVAREADRLGIPIFTPRSFKEVDAIGAMRAHGADAAVVVAYGLILPKPILEAFPLGCFNLHASLLPRWRGAAPINRAIIGGDRETGVMVMKMNEGLDTGPVVSMTKRHGLELMKHAIPIGPDATAGDLHDELKSWGAELTALALMALERGYVILTPQPSEGITYAAKIDKNETRIDWTRPWQEVHNHCRGLSPFPGVWCEMANVGRLKILRTTKGDGAGAPGAVLDDRLTVACGQGAVRIVELQRAGAKLMTAEEFLRGTPVGRGTALQ